MMHKKNKPVMMSLISSVLLFLLMMLLGCTKDKPIRVLIVDGFSNHDWQQTTQIVRQVLEETNLFVISVSTAPSIPETSAWETWHPRFENYDVVIQNTNNIGKRNLHWPREVEVALEKFVQAGGGLYILHSANNAFAHWQEYDHMIGLGWRRANQGYALEITNDGQIIRIPPGEGRSTSHGPRLDLALKILTPHPINREYPQAWKTPNLEVYTYARGPAENLTVLSFAYDEDSKKNWPIEWLVQYGKGQVYNSTMGHLWDGEINPPSMRCIGFQTTLIRVCEWLGNSKVTFPVPANFPTATELSLR